MATIKWIEHMKEDVNTYNMDMRTTTDKMEKSCFNPIIAKQLMDGKATRTSAPPYCTASLNSQRSDELKRE